MSQRGSTEEDDQGLLRAIDDSRELYLESQLATTRHFVNFTKLLSIKGEFKQFIWCCTTFQNYVDVTLQESVETSSRADPRTLGTNTPLDRG